MSNKLAVHNWFVVTGPPCSGKSTVLGLIERLGYRVIPEAARVIIEKEMAEGKTIGQIRGDEAAFQRRALKMKVEIENGLPKNETIFFDRAVPDSVAYFQICKLDPARALDACLSRQYMKVFLMEQLPFKQDGARTESPEAIKRLNRLLGRAYRGLGYEIVFVPRISLDRDISVAKRLLFILSSMHQ